MRLISQLINVNWRKCINSIIWLRKFDFRYKNKLSVIEITNFLQILTARRFLKHFSYIYYNYMIVWYKECIFGSTVHQKSNKIRSFHSLTLTTFIFIKNVKLLRTLNAFCMCFLFKKIKNSIIINISQFIIQRIPKSNNKLNLVSKVLKVFVLSSTNVFDQNKRTFSQTICIFMKFKNNYNSAALKLAISNITTDKLIQYL